MQQAVPIIELIKLIYDGTFDYQQLLNDNYEMYSSNFLSYSQAMLN